jgi:hypothetical protein
LSCCFAESQVPNKVVGNIAIDPVNLFTVFVSAEEAFGYQMMDIVIAHYTFIRKRYSQVPLAIRTVSQYLIAANVLHIAKIANRIVWVTLQRYPNFFYVQTLSLLKI